MPPLQLLHQALCRVVTGKETCPVCLCGHNRYTASIVVHPACVGWQIQILGAVRPLGCH